MSAVRLTRAAVKIPKRIERGPTDLLKALASTVKHIPNEPDTMIQDDPFLFPRKANDRSVFTLAKITGKNTAKFMLNKHPEMFFRDDAEPKVEAFFPPEEFNEDMEFTEADIKWCIDNNDPVNGLIAYKSLGEKGVTLSNETLLNFFELLCFTNEEKMLQQIDFQRNFYLRNNDRQLVNQTWKTTGYASKIFNQIKEDIDPPRVYSAMIAGLSKYNEHQAAQQVFEDFKQFHPEDGLYVEAYDGLISSVPKLHSSIETAYNAIDEIINHLTQHSVVPNLRLFNSILECYRSFNSDDTTCQKALKLVNDMRTLGIEPSLATYTPVMNILYRFKSGRVYGKEIEDLLSYIVAEDNLLQVRDERDAFFLRECMRIFASQMNNLHYANKLHKLYMKKPSLFSCQAHRQAYLDMYFRLIVTTEKLENILNFYDTYVPMNFRPTAPNYDVLAEALDLYQADDETVKRIGNDAVLFRVADKMRNDAIFRKHPEFVAELERYLLRG